MNQEVIESNALVRIVESSGLEHTKAEYILEKFSSYFQIASEWEKKAKMLTVTEISQVAEMKMAREGRLFLKGKRIDIEKARKELKEQSLREGRTIDNIANILKNLIEPIESYLEKQEKFAEIKEAEFRESRREERIKKLLPFKVETTFYDLLNMSDPEFDQLFKGIEFSYNQRIEFEKKEKADRIAREKAEAEERQRIRQENEQLRIAAEKQAILMAKQRADAEAERKKLEEKAERERIEQQKKLKALRDKQAEELRIEREEREKIEAELRAKEEAEYNAKCKAEVKAEDERKAKLAAEKKALKAPDRTKILKLAEFFEGIVLPDMKSDEGKKLMEKVSKYLIDLVEHLKTQAKEF
jgi:hypothetical protein